MPKVGGNIEYGPAPLAASSSSSSRGQAALSNTSGQGFEVIVHKFRPLANIFLFDILRDETLMLQSSFVSDNILEMISSS